MTVFTSRSSLTAPRGFASYIRQMDSTDVEPSEQSEQELDDAHWDAAQEGAELLREGEADAAVRHLTSVVLADPSNAYGFFFLGAAHFEVRDPLRALKAYLTCLELKPEYVGAMIATGRTLHALGRHRDALRMGRQVLARSKEDADALHLMGHCHFAMGDEAAALKYLERFLATRPELEVAMEVEGMLKVLRGEVDPAEEQPEEH